MNPALPSRRSWKLALGLSAGVAVSVVWDQAHWWASNPDLAFGFLAPAFCLFVVWERRKSLAEEFSALSAAGATRAPGFRAGLLTAVAALLVVAGSVGAWFGVAMDADSPLRVASAAFLHTVSSVGLVAGLLFLCLPAPSRPATAGGFLADARFRVLRLFFFPLGVWLLTTPPLGILDSGLSRFLRAKITGLVASLLGLAGLPVLREGNVLVFPTGKLGIAEACAGLRSLTGAVFAGAFLGAIFFRTWKPKAALLAAAIALAAVANFLRSLFLAVLCCRSGPSSVEGFLHDATGDAVLAVTAIGLLALVRLVRLFAELPRHGSREGAP